MNDVIRAAPARLEAYSEATVSTVGHARDAVDAYTDAVDRYNAAGPNDLGYTLDDRSGPLLDSLGRLRTLDELPAAFAAALRRVDQSFEPGRDGGPGVLSAGDRERFNRLVAEELVLGRLRSDDDGGLGEDIRDVGEWLTEQFGRLGSFDDWFRNLPDEVRLVFEEVTSVVRRTVTVIEELTADGWRLTVRTWDEFVEIVRRYTVDIDLRGLQRAAPFLKKLGLIGDVLSIGFSAWEQWDQDADRTDLSTTERVLRAGTDGVVRGGVQVIIGGVTTAAAGALVVAAPFSGGLTLILAGGIIAGGVVVGEWVDGPIADALDAFYDSDFGRWAIGGAADGIDAVGREIRDAALGARDLAVRGWNAGAEGLDDLREWGGDQIDAGAERLGDLRDWGGERVDDLQEWGGDTIDDLGEWGGERVDDLQEWGGDTIDDLGDRAQDLGEDLRDGVDRVGDAANDGLDAIGDAAGDTSDWVQDRWPF